MNAKMNEDMQNLPQELHEEAAKIRAEESNRPAL